MKTIIFFCVVALAFTSKGRVEQSCLEEPDEGTCRGYFESYYYDYKRKSCKIFIYGGCRGNGNRYSDEKECLSKCGGAAMFESDAICELPAEHGECRGVFPMYFFDKATGKCEEFIYGGCGGNENKFHTIEQCEKTCAAKAPELSACEQEKVVGPCFAAFRRFYYNKETRQCERFRYGGCRGNDNNFNSKEDCAAVCVAKGPVSSCEQEKVVGPCRGFFPRYFFNKESGQCEKFIYGGCDGNGNNFNSQEDCESVCTAKAPVSSCEQEKVVGPCRGSFPRYFFNKESGQCEKFFYGGCNGNDNNFNSQEDCESVCTARPAAVGVCELEQVVGPCRAGLPRYFFNKETGKCEEFKYGGCRGNENNFLTEEDCKAVCAA